MKVLERAAGHASGPYHVPGDRRASRSPCAPTTRCAARSAASAPTRRSSPWRACSTGWPSAVGISGWEIREAQRDHARRGVGPGPDHGRRLPRRRSAASTRSSPHYDAAVAAGKAVGLGLGLKNSASATASRRSPAPSCASRTTAPSRCATAGPRWARACTPSPCRSRSRSSASTPTRVRVIVDTTRELGAGQTTGSRGTLMGAGSVQTRAEAARADGCRPGVDYEGEYRVDWTNSLGDRASSTRSSTRRSATPRSWSSIDRETRRDRAGRRRPRRRPGGEPAAVRGPDRGLGAHGSRLRAHRGLPVPTPRRPPDEHDAAQPRHPPGQGRAADRGRSSSSRRSRTRPTASRASARSASCRPRARWPPRCTTSTASGAPRCRCAGAAADATSDRRPRPGSSARHHHLYSALARGMPAPPRTPTTFLEILEQVWWRLDAALDLEMIRWSAHARRARGARVRDDRDRRPPRVARTRSRAAST